MAALKGGICMASFIFNWKLVEAESRISKHSSEQSERQFSEFLRCLNDPLRLLGHSSYQCKRCRNLFIDTAYVALLSLIVSNLLLLKPKMHDSFANHDKLFRSSFFVTSVTANLIKTKFLCFT